MEDVLEVYCRAYDPKHPQVCIDETSKQMLQHTRTPIPATAGTPARVDDEYKRCGTANIFLCIEPLTGKTVVEATEHRAKVDFAHFVRELCDGPYRDADKLVVVMDNLNTHSLGSLYEAFEPSEARRLAKRLEIHYTPKHASWLNIAENEIGVLSSQCLDRRIEDCEEFRREVAAWECERNEKRVEVDWKFTVEMARVKLRRVYPVISQN